MAVLLAITVAAYAQRSGAGLQVRVTDESGAIVLTAVVTVTGTDGVARQLPADGSGAYALKGLPQGKYTVRATGPDGKVVTKQVDLKGQAERKLTIHLD